MSERDFWNQESLEEYRADLIRQRNELNPITNRTHIKVLDEIIKNLPEKYPEQVYVDDFSEKPKATFKEKISDTFGAFGVVLYFIIRMIITILPFVMIGGNFFLTLLLISINTFVPFASVVFWIWGLVCAIQGVQDIWAIIYYIAFVLIWIPFFMLMVSSLFSKDK